MTRPELDSHREAKARFREIWGQQSLTTEDHVVLGDLLGEFTRTTTTRPRRGTVVLSCHLFVRQGSDARWLDSWEQPVQSLVTNNELLPLKISSTHLIGVANCLRVSGGVEFVIPLILIE